MMENPFRTEIEPSRPLPKEFWLDVNTATEDELAEVARLGLDRARLLVRHRPFTSWKDVQKRCGFSRALVEKIEQSGVLIRPPGSS
jgi:DNA uptake protein ComE-like DNA-binding protein